VKLKTFFIEDNLTIRENLIATLTELAQVESVGSCDNESEAKAWLLNPANDWHLAIVDLFLKVGTGLGVVAACRGRAAHQKIIVLSNYATADVRTRCLALGADAVLDKSTEIDALIEMCTAQLSARGG
jgi:two-component system, OmpR family, response regulator